MPQTLILMTESFTFMEAWDLEPKLSLEHVPSWVPAQVLSYSTGISWAISLLGTINNTWDYHWRERQSSLPLFWLRKRGLNNHYNVYNVRLGGEKWECEVSANWGRQPGAAVGKSGWLVRSPEVPGVVEEPWIRALRAGGWGGDSGRGVTRWMPHDLVGSGEDLDIYAKWGGSCGGCEQRRAGPEAGVWTTGCGRWGQSWLFRSRLVMMGAGPGWQKQTWREVGGFWRNSEGRAARVSWWIDYCVWKRGAEGKAWVHDKMKGVCVCTCEQSGAWLHDLRDAQETPWGHTGDALSLRIMVGRI